MRGVADHDRGYGEHDDDPLEPLRAAAGVTREVAEAADKVTNVCDVISFEFCFEEENEREVRGFGVRVDGHGLVEVDPWPFAVPRLVGLVTAFERDGYPGRLAPVVVPYDVRPYSQSRGTDPTTSGASR